MLIPLIAEAEAVTAQLLRDRLHLPRRHALHVHLRQRPDQRLLRTLVALEQTRREAPFPVLRHPQLQRTNPGYQRAGVVAGAVAEPLRRPLALVGAERRRHLRFQRRLDHRLDHRPKIVFVPIQQRLDVDRRRLILLPGHGMHPLQGPGDVEHHQRAMTARLAKPAFAD